MNKRPEPKTKQASSLLSHELLSEFSNELSAQELLKQSMEMINEVISNCQIDGFQPTALTIPQPITEAGFNENQLPEHSAFFSQAQQFFNEQELLFSSESQIEGTIDSSSENADVANSVVENSDTANSDTANSDMGHSKVTHPDVENPEIDPMSASPGIAAAVLPGGQQDQTASTQQDVDSLAAIDNLLNSV